MNLKYILIAGVTGLGLLFFLFVENTRSSSLTNYPPKNERIVAFGDSLVQGYGATEGHDFVSILGTKLGREIVNLGRSGDTTMDGVLRMDEVVEEAPGTVVLLLGGNDYLRRMEESVSRENLSMLIRTFQEEGAVVVLLGVRGGIILDGREEMYDDLSKEYGTVYIDDVLRGVFNKPEYMFDGIHPNDAGYALIADRLYEVFREYNL
jgi:lysophospholipase L1-like esterase